MTIESLYQDYLRKVELDENKMIPIQKTETRRAFYGGFAEFFNLVMHECENFNDAEYHQILNGFSNEILTFWNNETNTKDEHKTNLN